MSILSKYQETLEATLGAIAAHSVVQSKDSSKTIRDCSKLLDNMSVELRKELIELDKSYVLLKQVEQDSLEITGTTVIQHESTN